MRSDSRFDKPSGPPALDAFSPRSSDSTSCPPITMSSMSLIASRTTRSSPSSSGITVVKTEQKYWLKISALAVIVIVLTGGKWQWLWHPFHFLFTYLQHFLDCLLAMTPRNYYKYLWWCECPFLFLSNFFNFPHFASLVVWQ